MDILSLLLSISGLILIIIFIILGIKLIILTNEASRVITNIEKEVENYKNKFSSIFAVVDYFSNITERSSFFVRKLFKKIKK